MSETKLTDEEILKLVRKGLGEAFHTAFRKASDSKEAHEIWLLINKMNSNDWSNIVNTTLDWLQVPEGIKKEA